jgi:hypothetical protein
MSVNVTARARACVYVCVWEFVTVSECAGVCD